MFVDKISDLGYNKRQVLHAVTENLCDDLSATYMLLKVQLNEVKSGELL